MILWLIFCLVFLLILTTLVLAPLARHPSLPRRKKWLFCVLIFLILVPGGLALYGWVGMPPMALY